MGHRCEICLSKRKFVDAVYMCIDCGTQYCEKHYREYDCSKGSMACLLLDNLLAEQNTNNEIPQK